jgi:hypothetical protein
MAVAQRQGGPGVQGSECPVHGLVTRTRASPGAIVTARGGVTGSTLRRVTRARAQWRSNAPKPNSQQLEGAPATKADELSRFRRLAFCSRAFFCTAVTRRSRPRIARRWAMAPPPHAASSGRTSSPALPPAAPKAQTTPCAHPHWQRPTDRVWRSVRGPCARARVRSDGGARLSVGDALNGRASAHAHTRM